MTRIGFIGGFGHHYLAKTVGADDVVAVASDGRFADAARERFTFTNATWFDEPIAMLDTFAPDVVSVGAVYALNGAFVAEAMSRDIPVITDKPMASSWAQLERIKTLHAQNPSRIAVTEFNFRSEPAWRAARQAVLDGRIGEVVLATGQKSYKFGNRPVWCANRDDYGGTILWIASHAIDFVSFVTDLSFARVFGAAANISRADYGTMEETTVSVFELTNGAPAVIHADLNRPAAAATHGDDRLRIAGSAALIEIRDRRCLLTTNEQPECDITDTVEVEPPEREMRAALCGEPSPWYGTVASLETAAVLLHARNAADRGEIITMR